MLPSAQLALTFQGIFISRVSEEGPAARAGVRVGDKLLEVSRGPWRVHPTPHRPPLGVWGFQHQARVRGGSGGRGRASGARPGRVAPLRVWSGVWCLPWSPCPALPPAQQASGSSRVLVPDGLVLSWVGVLGAGRPGLWGCSGASGPGNLGLGTQVWAAGGPHRSLQPARVLALGLHRREGDPPGACDLSRPPCPRRA